MNKFLINNQIYTDTLLPESFFAVNFSEDTMTSAVFPEQLVIGKYCYTRLEYHRFDPEKRLYTVENRCYRSSDRNALGSLCAFSEVPQWSKIKEVTVLKNVEQSLFSYFKMPFANTVAPESPLGYNQNGKPILPKGRERMFRTYNIQATEKPFIETFSPEIRDISLFNGLNRIFQRIEFNCGLAYGTISDLQTIEKTAEEIKSSKQRSYTQVSAIQKNLEFTLKNLLYSYNYYAKYFGLSQSESKLICTWGDSILEDIDKEFQRHLQMVSAGLLTKEKFIAWYFHCDEKQASKYIPQADALFGGI